MKEKIKNNYKILVAFILGGLILGGLGTAYAVSIASSSVSYDNTTSGAEATDVKGAIDELYSLAKSKSCPSGYTKSGTDDTYTCTNDNLFKYGVYSDDNSLTLNSSVPSNAILYSNVDDALNEWEENSDLWLHRFPFYFKHKIEDGIVKETYVVFIVTEDMAQSNPGMTAGTYELRGYTDNRYYETNKELLIRAFGSSRCSLTSHFEC